MGGKRVQKKGVVASIGFYHLTTGRAQDVLPGLLAKTLEAGKRALVALPPEWTDRVSETIWSRPPDGWLAHGVAGRDDEDAALCPVWLAASDAEPPNGAHYFFYLGETSPSEAVLADEGTERLFLLFDGLNAGELDHARRHWKAWKGSGHQLDYFKQQAGGSWEKQG